ncbi:MAG: EAL domain-containing protein [Bacillota bacterium]|nr:EAL domain-containing protein [Bacillota bacterium]
MLQIIISSIFYVTFILYVFLGVYSIALNRKAALNRIFLLVCISFSVWAFTFAMGNVSKTFEEAVLWRRISSLGWGVSYSIVLHFALVLTERKNILRSRGVYAAIYIPAAYNVYYYAVSGSTQYRLERTIAGWASLPLKGFGDMFFNVYYSLFSLLTLMLILRWYFTTKDEMKRKHAIYIFTSLAVSLLLGTITDILANRYLSFKIPSLAPIIILIPIVTIFYTIHKYGLMVPVEKQKTFQEGTILSTDNRTFLFRYISLVIVIGCVINVILSFAHTKGLVLGGVLNVILLLCGVFMFAISTIIQSPKLQDNVLQILLTVAMIVVMFIYYDKAVSNTVWPVPLFFIILTIIFNNKKMLAIVASAGLLIELVTWARIPELEIRIAAGDYSFRIAFYILGVTLTAYISKIYVSRLRENEKQTQFQEMISSISTSFVTVAGGNFHEKVMEMLKKSGCYTYADRSYIGMFHEGQKRISITHEWLGEGMPQVASSPNGFDSINFTWWSSQLLQNKIVFIPSIEALPSEAKPERELMKSRGVNSLIFIPIANKDKVIGFIGFDKIADLKGWRIEDNELLRVLANIMADAMTKVEVEKEMNYLAYYDALTGLPNRTLLNNRLEQAIQLAGRIEKYVGVIFLDLDGFKGVNDTIGHDCGDNLLKQVGERLANCTRKYDTVARFGGDEFLIMIPQASRVEDIEAAAKKVMEAFRSPVVINEQEFFISTSAGIAVFPQDGEDGNTLIKNADLAMYHAKNNGKGQYVFCSTGMKDNVLKRMTLTNSLYRALERNELVLYYQPQVSLKTKEIIGLEALIRWDHPELGRIPPNEFIPIAEQTGLINSIGEWVIRTACRQNKAWQDMGLKPLKMAVNISVEQFRSGSLLKIVKESLEETGLEPGYLELEITEGIAMKESQYIVGALQQLKALGLEISIDDFGMEYSSLSRLKDLPIGRLKMDMQFISGIAVNSRAESIVTVIIDLAKSLGLKVIAEGVEKEVQVNFLEQEQCDEVQGYYYYKPMPEEEVQCVLETRGRCFCPAKLH